ncbi:hypothetical protein FB45DRAFT_1033890 [Roridomyces roridus]|uniref:AMP-dependent synthetase/ligase domain-containing protein n=1 Tax=Roridomyces roridus TaxID=1738132 RepID=A0AAD7BEV7_9AGAR|nr:hypothetical protein FB45DRAFT_1033890 [Roridomyces roridus]
MSAMPASILDIFITTANDPSTCGRRGIECGSDAWTYAELEAMSNAMAHELKDLLGLRPKVAFVGENHPYVFALMLAVWKIGGIFIPIDAHVPPALLDGMLDIVKPACMYLSAVDVSNVSRASKLPVEVRVFHPENSTIPTLNKQYGSGSTALKCKYSADEPCMYLFTSSASSAENLKAVPLTPKLILSNCQSKLAWWREIQPTATLDGTRVLGWAPWSHVLSHMQDIGTATRSKPGPDLTTRVIDGVLNKKVTALAALPFVISGMKDEYEGGCTALIHALRGMTMLECGGASLDPAVAEWAESSGVPLMVGIGMTETGGAIFVGRAKESLHGFSQGALIAGAKLSLDACEGAVEGELVVKSKLLPHGYIGYNDGSFSVDSQGWVMFKTRDRYRVQDSKFLWLGRATDYIQACRMTSGESLDPRPIEKMLRSAALISDACIIGDTFLRGASTAVCAIVELSGEAKRLDTASKMKEVARVLAPINAASPPALRISMASVLILNGAEKIPRTKKGDVFRKKIEDVFGKALKGGVASWSR